MNRSPILPAVCLISACFFAALAAGPASAQEPVAASDECVFGENSRGVCVGKWLYFVGSNNSLDNGVWIVRIDRETGEIWHKNGKWMVKMQDKQ